MRNSAQKVWPNNSRSEKLVFLVAALGAYIVAAPICTGAAPTQDAKEPIWPTKEWQTSTPEEQGMDSKELAKLVDFGAARILTSPGITLSSLFDSLLVVRHGKIVVEAYYAPYAAGIPHTINSVTKAVISTLMAIAFKDGLLDSPNHRGFEFFDRRNIENLDDRKEAITVQSLLDMTSGLEWTEPLDGRPDSAIEMERSPDWVKFILDKTDVECSRGRLQLQQRQSASPFRDHHKTHGNERPGIRKSQTFWPSRNQRCVLAARSSRHFERGLRFVFAASRHGEDWLSVPAQWRVGR